MQTQEAFTLEIKASDLPESVLSRFSCRPADDVRFFVTTEPEQKEEERYLALKHCIQEGIEDSDAGRVIDGATVFSELKAHFSAA